MAVFVCPQYTFFRGVPTTNCDALVEHGAEQRSELVALAEANGWRVAAARDDAGIESREVADGVVLDFDARGDLVGIDIDNASQRVDLTVLALSRLPARVETVAA